ncbi:expressed unknown protein [Ectocarpus siliculosus]|uniref:Uncharacterized protein n=1 Tax=Ectocarpus siliculosus TaxID=2880 RepID=D8LGJ9_ECTSI|nr:expressed unknown protein [Ectocarpus siliculosus]|eukprot:CBN79056.1 expressed unknown protein [Ectocarpus siliculosus]
MEGGAQSVQLQLYTGGIAAAAACGGAASVWNVDFFSASAQEVGRASLKLNAGSAGECKCEWMKRDVLPTIRQLAGTPTKDYRADRRGRNAKMSGGRHSRDAGGRYNQSLQRDCQKCRDLTNEEPAIRRRQGTGDVGSVEQQHPTRPTAEGRKSKRRRRERTSCTVAQQLARRVGESNTTVKNNKYSSSSSS